MYKVQIKGGYVLGGRLQAQIAVKCVTRFNDNDLAGLDPRHRLDPRVITIEAIWIVLAMIATFSNGDRRLMRHISGVGVGGGNECRHEQCRPEGELKATHLSSPL